MSTGSTNTQEQRAVDRFRLEREREYSEIVRECRKALNHIGRERERGEFHFEEVEELEGDLEKIRRWYTDVATRDYWAATARAHVDEAIAEVEADLAAFVEETYARTEASRDGGAPEGPEARSPD